MAADGWSDAVEDLVEIGDVDGAVSLLESVISKIKTQDPPSPPSALRLAAALSDLADIHSSRGFTLKSDDIRSRALLIRARAGAGAVQSPPPRDLKLPELNAEKQEETGVSNQGEDEDEDDWEAIADRGEVDDISLSPQKEAGAQLSTSCSDMELGIPKRRGRGSFLYKKSCLYSEQSNVADHQDGVLGSDDENKPAGVASSRYGYGHVLVLYDFPLSTRTTELERLFDSFRDGGVVIRWVNDTVALAVFRTPQLGSNLLIECNSKHSNEAQRSVCCPFKVRILAQNDDLLPQLSTKDLEPPYPRPKTSARTAQRLIAQGMGIKLPTDFGSNELRKQEEARKNRILARQTLKEDAWGSDNPH